MSKFERIVSTVAGKMENFGKGLRLFCWPITVVNIFVSEGAAGLGWVAALLWLTQLLIQDYLD